MAVPTRSQVEALIAERIAAHLELVAGGVCWSDGPPDPNLCGCA